MQETVSIILSLVSGIMGAVIGGIIAGIFIYWQTFESARSNLRAVVTRMAIHAKKGRGIPPAYAHAIDPWSMNYMDEAIAAYHRYRGLLFRRGWREKLDVAWTTFQGVDPNGPDRFLAVQMMSDTGAERATHLLNMLNASVFNGWFRWFRCGA